MLFKDKYLSNQDLTLTPYGLAQQLINVYGQPEGEPGSQTYVMNLPVMGEVLIQGLSHSSLDDFPANDRGIIEALYYLNARVESIRKTLTTWDAYQIKGTLQNRDLVLSQLTQLPPNSSLVSNIELPFSWVNKNQETITVHKGDIFVKDNNEEIYHIKSLSNGYYAPVSIVSVPVEGQSTNNFAITYQYYTDYPKEGTKPQGASDDFAYETMSLEFAPQNEEYGYYERGSIEVNTNYSFDVKKDNNNIIIRPIIKIFTTDYEQIFTDQVISINSDHSKFIINNVLPITILYEVK